MRYSKRTLDLLKAVSEDVETHGYRVACELRTLCHHVVAENNRERTYQAARRQAIREREQIPPKIFPANYPPDDPRHIHDTDAGGNCRGRDCGYNTDPHL